MAGEASYSRFALNWANGDSLPVWPLVEPDGQGGLGAVLVGDYIANDFVAYQESRDPNFRDRWLVASTTQSDAVPVTVDSTDLNLFSNASGIPEYLESKAGKVPYSVDIADGLFVDPDIFRPPETEGEPRFDIFYLAKWFPTKKTELLIEAARKRPDIRVGIYGWLMASERKRAESERYRDEIMASAADLPNVTIMDSTEMAGGESHLNPDGSVVLGALTKEQIRDTFLYDSRMGIYLSERTEAVNRFGIEMLMCDRPLIVALPTHGGMERFMVDGKTSVFCERSADGIIAAHDQITADREGFTPRETALTFGGKQAINGLLRTLLEGVAEARGARLSNTEWRSYGGDLWTPPTTYATIG